MAKKFYTGVDLQGQIASNAADPSSSSDLATKAYVDNNLAGLRWKQPVRVATTANGTLATAFENGDTVDGVVIATGERILLKNQTDPTENGIRIVAASGAPTRATDADAFAELNSATVFVQEGTANADKAFTQTTELTSLSDSQVWVQFGGGQAYTASNGLTLVGSDFRIDSSAAGSGLGFSGGVLSTNTDTTTIEVSSDALRIAASAAGAGLTGGGASALAVGAGSGVTVNANDVAVDSSVSRIFTIATHASTTSIAITHSLGRQYVKAAVFITSTGEEVECDVVATSTTVTTFTFAVAPSANTLTFTILG